MKDESVRQSGTNRSWILAGQLTWKLTRNVIREERGRRRRREWHRSTRSVPFLVFLNVCSFFPLSACPLSPYPDLGASLSLPRCPPARSLGRSKDGHWPPRGVWSAAPKYIVVARTCVSPLCFSLSLSLSHPFSLAHCISLFIRHIHAHTASFVLSTTLCSCPPSVLPVDAWKNHEGREHAEKGLLLIIIVAGSVASKADLCLVATPTYFSFFFFFI